MRFLSTVALALLVALLALISAAPRAAAEDSSAPRLLHPDREFERLFSTDTQVVVRRQGRGASLTYKLCPAPSQPRTLLRYSKYIEFAQLDGTADVYSTRMPMCEHDTCEMRVRESNGCLDAAMQVLFPVDLSKDMIVRIFDFDGRQEYLFK
jgi:hypothetical protein